MATVATVAAARPGGRRRGSGMPSWLGGVLGIVGLLIVWQILGLTVFSKGRAIPPPTHIISQMHKDGFALYWNNAVTTLHEAAIGYLWGNALAILCALTFLVLPAVERPLMRLGIASFCLPVIAIGPILQIVFNGETPKIILAALSVFFTTLVGMLVGLRSADKTTLDVIHAYGGNGFRKLTKVRLRAALPSLFAALRIAAPAALLGAIIGEYLGADSGLGVAMINSEQAFQIERTWAIALVATAIAGIAYGITALVGRLLTPWATPARRR
jgi:ABC-type nitrate/sulfonate/bicarbonate transport system permease component